MRKNDFHPYIAAGLTAFAVLAGGILLFFAVFHWGAVLKFLNLLSYTLRPVFYGMVLAFLLLPIQRGFNHLLTGCVVGKRTPGEQEQKLLRFLVGRGFPFSAAREMLEELSEGTDIVSDYE